MKLFILIYYFLEDYWLIFRNRCLYYLHPNPPEEWETGSKGDVVLIQGLNARWVSLKKIAYAVNRFGYRVHTVPSLESNTKPIPAASLDVKEYILDNNLNNVILIGHSKGGIVAIYSLKNKDLAKRISKVINIAGPVKGTLLSWLSSSEREMVPSSDFISHYREGIRTKKIINIYPLIDDFIIPNKNLQEKGDINKKINVVGHIRIVEAKQTIEAIKNLLKSISNT